ncbi:glycosyltransferase family 87 protein [Cupriavidus oxalaticus]|jgi:hypothetical protein|uniref:DUF2029 domain-containing protein n=1 Tax=Cupriavidus oxalaticus TaxID=96344 RepID=A0A976BER2_9BURK|nr:glycosyltransferase family 87 protein [Cupriavidus oxalaticus]QRQ86754.1 DUF2029 domain-containing protein [Cupriavidus oxalaticus]QRQ94918.1 DUF2029 domain-containing protein [Cupriavidus oxalaticus]WQD83572.1 glycosyltransferase family 87 protein [Cupriavidus oxalaticus]SPC16823.1 conserved membrane hypothetical protein [Cupriavidus oxalaticus]
MSGVTKKAAACVSAIVSPHGLPHNSAHSWLTPERVYLYAAAVLIIESVLTAAWWYGHWILKAPQVPLLGWDLAVYWSASGLAQGHGAAAAYDWPLLQAAEAPLLPGTFGPFAYPPTFLLMVYPLASVSFGLALLLSSIIGLVLYLWAMRAAVHGQYARWWMPALAFPGIWAALLAGQNTLITASACAAALLLMHRHAFAAGACVALLCIKPQLGVLFPLLFACERRWAVMTSAAACSAVFFAFSGMAFGIDIFPAFARSMTMFGRTVAEHGGPLLRGAPTIFAVLRTAGAEAGLSYAGHALGAAIAAGTCTWLWLTHTRPALGASALVVGTLLVQPYLMYYDLAWLAIPIALLCSDFARHGSTLTERLLLCLVWIVPAHALLVVIALPSPQVAPVVLFALLGMIARRHHVARPTSGTATAGA